MAFGKQTVGIVDVQPPNFAIVEAVLIGTTPHVANKMTRAALEAMIASMMGGQAAKNQKKRDPVDFDELYRQAQHRSAEGWYGVPAIGLRKALISACRVASLTMSKMKLTIFPMADGYDADDGYPLIRITHGEPRCVKHLVKNADGGATIRARPMLDAGWRARVRIKYDADQITAAGVMNLLARAGAQVGLGAGRADSANSAGMGWGEFRLATEEDMLAPDPKRRAAKKGGTR